MTLPELTPQRGLIFRITHVDNLPWIFANGLHCANGGVLDPNFVAIGNSELIGKRTNFQVRHAMGGTLADYVPFYFTPRSPMLLNIQTGRGGVVRRAAGEIGVLVSAVPRLVELGLSFLVADGHAVYRRTNLSDDPQTVSNLDWNILRACDFQRDEADPGKFERYQAEALVRDHVPIEALVGVGFASQAALTNAANHLPESASGVKLVLRPGWFF